MRRILQFIQWKQSGDKWVLKTPFHLDNLDVLINVFPGTKVIWMHRDPAKCVPSYCSLVTHTRLFDSNIVDPLAIGPKWSDNAAKSVLHAMKTREKIGDDPFLDINFTNLIKDPLKEAMKVYEFIGWQPPENLASIVHSLRQKPGKAKAHKYSAADFGLSDINKKFQIYIDRFIKKSTTTTTTTTASMPKSPTMTS